jgi:hypothetical protein
MTTAFDRANKTILKDKNLSEDAVIVGIGVEGDEGYVADRTIRCTFLDPFSDSEFNNKVKIANSNPEIHCASEDVLSVKNGDKIFVRGQNFYVSGAPRPDGNGNTVLLLTEDEG